MLILILTIKKICKVLSKLLKKKLLRIKIVIIAVKMSLTKNFYIFLSKILKDSCFYLSFQVAKSKKMLGKSI